MKFDYNEKDKDCYFNLNDYDKSILSNCEHIVKKCVLLLLNNNNSYIYKYDLKCNDNDDDYKDKCNDTNNFIIPFVKQIDNDHDNEKNNIFSIKLFAKSFKIKMIHKIDHIYIMRKIWNENHLFYQKTRIQ